MKKLFASILITLSICFTCLLFIIISVPGKNGTILNYTNENSTLIDNNDILSSTESVFNLFTCIDFIKQWAMKENGFTNNSNCELTRVLVFSLPNTDKPKILLFDLPPPSIS